MGGSCAAATASNANTRDIVAITTIIGEAITMVDRWVKCLGALAVVSMLLASPSLANASEEIGAFSVSTSSTQAGGHPDLSAFFKLENPGQPETARDISVDAPPGIFGNPRAIPLCNSLDFALNECASGSQAGVITVRGFLSLAEPNHLFGTAPVYDMEPISEFETARYAFLVPEIGIPINIPVTVRSASDYGLTLTISGITQQIPFASAQLELWGFPADAEHDPLRFPKGSPGAASNCPGSENTSCISAPYPSAGVVPAPMIDNPSVCTEAALPVSISVVTYQDSTPSTAESSYPATTGCENQVFHPILNVGLTTDQTDAPSGLDMQLKAAQLLGVPPSPSQLRSASVTLPTGLSINPDAADGQTACSDAEAAFGSNEPGHCLDSAKIGTVELHSPAIAGPLTGSLYFGEPKPGNQYRVFMILDGFGVHAKFFVSVKPNPQTGQLTMSLVDLPQVPFESFDIHLFASDRGMLATPTQCQVYEVDSVFTPWNAMLAPQHSNPNVGVSTGPGGSECPGERRPFRPRLAAGMSNALAGAYSSFTLKLDRDDGDQFLGDLNFKMPPGFTGDLSHIGYCPEGAIAQAATRPGRLEQSAPSCPASSQIGTTNVSAGPGSHPFHALGKIYLAGPFKGAPLSIVAVTPALAGPYDYGTVVVRVGIYVDPLTAQVKAISDTVPSIIGGVPIRMRSIQVNIDRPNFTINPTNCSPSSVDSQGIGDQGTVTDFSSFFQAVNCFNLPFRPSMKVRQVGSKKATRRGRDPSLRFSLQTRRGDANIKAVSVTLSNSYEIDQNHLRNICTEKELEATACSGRQAIGTAETKTPLLAQPLSGNVYAVSGSGGLPRLAFILDGQVDLMPRADTTTVKGGRLMTTVPVVPDAPIGHFRLDLFGGSRGYLSNTRDVCAKRPVVQIRFIGQNGKERDQKVRVKAPCGKKHKKKH